MARTQVWLPVVLVLGLGAGAGCASSGDDPKTDLTPVGTGAVGGQLPPQNGGAAGGGGMVTMTPIPSAAGGATAAGMGATGGTTVVGGAGSPAAGNGAAGGGDMMAAGSGGMAGSEEPAAGSGVPTDPGTGIHREADPTMMSAMSAGEYDVESYTSGMRDGPAYAGATIYYPTDAEPPFGAVTIVPGFTAYQSSIKDWGPFLASHGIIAMTIDTNTTGDLPALRAEGLMDALETIKAENTRAGSPLEGKVDVERFGVAGWSMGGGGTLIACSDHPTLKAGVSFAAWGPTGGAMNQVPVLMFEATADILAASMSDGFYQQTPETTPKMLFEVAGSSHNVANSPHNHDGIIGLYGLSWFKVFLEGDERYRQFLTASAPSIVTNKYATNVK